MRAFVRRARIFWHDRRGGTAIEYGLILSLIVIVLIVSLRGLANTTTGMWNDISNKVVQNGPRP